MQTINFDIGNLLKKIRAGHFLIPQFQRDFTWKEGQTRLLIDSIARNIWAWSKHGGGNNPDCDNRTSNFDDFCRFLW